MFSFLNKRTILERASLLNTKNEDLFALHMILKLTQIAQLLRLSNYNYRIAVKKRGNVYATKVRVKTITQTQS